LTAVVVTVNVAVTLPAGTVIAGGTTAAGLLLDNETRTPPVGAAPVSETVPVEGFRSTTVAGFSVRLESET
jgi:hypothetical protein